MPGYAHFSVARMYAVEVSGWDRMEEFFVEKCDLHSQRLVVPQRKPRTASQNPQKRRNSLP